MKMKKIFLTLIFMLGLSGVVAAAPAEQQLLGNILTKDTQIFSLSGHNKLIFNKFDNSLSVFNLTSNKEAWTKQFSKIYSINVLSFPEKIIVMAKGTDDKLQKIVMNKDGRVLSTQVIHSPAIANSIKTNRELISWNAPTGKNKERLTIYSNNTLFIYQSPWKNPTHKIKLSEVSSNKYEGTYINDIKLNWPYAVIKYTGNSLMQSQDFFRVINVLSLKEYTIVTDWNVHSDSSVVGDQLVINSSFNVGNPMGVNLGQSHLIYSTYNMPTGKKTASVSQMFTNTEMGWKSEVLENNVLVYIPEKERIEIYNASGRKLSEASLKIPSNSRGIDYSNGDLTLLVSEEAGVVLKIIKVSPFN